MAIAATVTEDFPTILRRARSAVDMLAQLHIGPTPARITVAFAHQSGEMPDLSIAMNRLASHDKMTAQAVDEIHDQFFGRHVEEAQLRDASRRIERTVAEVADCIDVASGSASRYGSVLADFTDRADERHHASEMVARVTTVLDETRQMAEANRRLEERLQASSHEIETLRNHLERLEREANTDSLTGIANRKSFDTALREAILQAGRDSEPLCLLMIDIDLFKAFNDAHGHLLGDQVLRLVARYMTECIKAQDTAARYGGEEFGVILPRTLLENALPVANQIRRHVSAKKVVNRRTGVSLGQITLSIGAAQYRPGESSAELVNRADEALYLAKANGRNRVVAETDLPVVA
jgi:diguanylate cyclase